MKFMTIISATATLWLACALAAQQTTPAHARLQEMVNAIAAEHKGRLAEHAENIKTDVLTMMIALSDNTATNLAIERMARSSSQPSLTTTKTTVGQRITRRNSPLLD
jgi:beta-lactamase class A